MTRRINISVTEEMHEALAKLAEERKVSIAYLVREAAAVYLERSKIRVEKIHPEWGGWRGDGD